MKKLLCLLVITISSVGLVLGQEILETIVHPPSAFNYAISRTKTGNFLAAATENIRSTTNFSTLYDSNGALLWSTKLCEECLDLDNCSLDECTREIVKSEEAPDGNLIHIIGDGKIYRTDANGEHKELLYNLGEGYESRNTGIYQVVREKEVLNLYSFYSNSSGSTVDSLLQLDLSSYQLSNPMGLEEKLGVRYFLTNGDILKRHFDGVLERRTSTGRQLWEIKLLAPNGQRLATIRNITEDTTGEIYVCGTIESNEYSENRNAFIACVDEFGTILWLKEYPPINNCEVYEGRRSCYHDLFHIQVSPTGLIAGGRQGLSGGFGPSSDVAILSTDFDGNILWEIKEQVVGEGHSIAYVSSVEDGTFWVIGTGGISDAAGGERTFFLRVGLATNTQELPHTNFQVYPNPVSVGDAISIVGAELGATEVAIYGSDGRLVSTKTYSNITEISIVLPDLPGLYTVQLTTETGTISQRVVVQ